MEDNITKIKDRIDVVDLVGEYIKLQKSGVNFKARCPFHNEKTPSFYVSPERQIWHCFGCSKGGSIFDFIMEMDGIEFSESLQTLARRAGIELKDYDNQFQNERVKLFDINQRASRFFEKQIWESNTGKKALVYLNNRGVKNETIKNFNLGFAPDSWDSLFTFLRNSGFQAEDIQKAGLILKKEGSSGYYDRFRSRIVFPIADSNNKIVGFTGRIFPSNQDDKIAKYINTPQTSIYDKSRVLFGLDKAKLAIKREDRGLLVEGNMDVIMSHQAGVENCVASSGTALTNKQAGILKRYTKKVDLCFDTDTAGLQATDRGVITALSAELDVGIVEIDDAQCKDPADYVAKYGKKWKEKVKERKPIVDYYFDKTFSSFDSQKADGKRKISNKLLPVIKSIGNALEKSHWIAELAVRLDAREEDIRSEMEKASPLIDINSIQIKESNLISGKSSHSVSHLEDVDPNIIENYIISLLLKHPLWYKENCGKIHDKIKKEIFSEVARLVLEKLSNHSSDKLNLSEFINSFDDEIRKKMEVWYLQSQTQWEDIKESEFEEEFSKLTYYLKKKYLNAKLTSLESKIKQAERSNDKETVTSLLKQFSDLSRGI